MTGSDRLLVLAPRGRDAPVVVARLAAAGTIAEIAGPLEIVAAIRAGELAAAVIADEAMASFDPEALARALAEQPAWSDCPFLVLTRREFGGWTPARLAAVLGNVTLLERPLHSDVLVSGVRSALRARARQRRAQSYLLARKAAEVQVGELAATLEARVAERTEALSEALAEQARIQARLRESEELYRYTVELTDQTPWTADAGGRLIAIGRSWANLGPKPVTAWRALVHRDDLDALRAAWTAATADATRFLCDFRVRLADGTFGWCRSRAAPRIGADGAVVRWYGTLEDIDDRRAAATKLRQMQSELIHVSRLSAMGAMASTLAHELNQPLTAITNYVRGSRRLLAGRRNVAAVVLGLDHADRNAVRAGDIIRRVRDQVTKGDVERRPIGLSDLVREACSLAMIDAAASGIEVRLELSRVPILVLVDRIQIQQVLLNLLRNAVEAVAAAPVKRVVVTTRTSTALCRVTVVDTGPGVPPAFAARLFAPFNTTKADGMGIGLSISKTIIEAHGGELWHETADGGGAAFAFSLVTVPG